uniref:Uncharacterized protein n=1 Tax=Anguilla anguilla TaxID=7936 RepID=A0A0E9VMB6_ANGAN
MEDNKANNNKLVFRWKDLLCSWEHAN